jgi:hypothetical protein
MIRKTYFWAKRKIWVVWSSGWVRTLFFNPTRFDEQESKSSPRIKVRELAQDSGSDGLACPDPTRNLKMTAQPVNWTFDSGFGHTTSSGWTFERTKILFRFNPSNKNPNPVKPLGQKCLSGSTRRAKALCPTLPKPRVERPSSGSTQPDGHSKSERFEILLTKKTRCIREFAKLSNDLNFECYLTTAYLLNRTFSASLKWDSSLVILQKCLNELIR